MYQVNLLVYFHLNQPTYAGKLDEYLKYFKQLLTEVRQERALVKRGETKRKFCERLTVAKEGGKL